MPIWLQHITNAMPFQSMVHFPVSVFLGNLSTNEMLRGFLFQASWIIILLILSKLIYRMAIKKVTIAGG